MTKPFLLIVALLFPILVGAQDKLPNRYELLTEKYERAIERANKPITQKYITELKQLKNDMTQRGDLQQALQIDKKLKEIAPTSDSLRSILLSRKWTYSTGKKTDPMVFNPDGTRNKSKLPWVLKDDRTLMITYSDGNTCTFKFPADLKNLSVQGVTGNGLKRWLKPAK